MPSYEGYCEELAQGQTEVISQAFLTALPASALC